MRKLIINPNYLKLLNEYKLDNYQAIKSTQRGEIVEDNAKREIRKIILNDEVLYLKRTKTEKILSAIEQLLLGRTPHSKPYTEMLHAKLLQQAGIAVMEVVAAGEHTQFGLPKGGFILSKEVPGQDGENLYSAANALERIAICKALGALMARLHSKGFFATTRLKDVFGETNSAGSLTFKLIDRETRTPHIKKLTAKRALNSLITGFRRQKRAGSSFSNDEQNSFAQAYCAEINQLIAITPAEISQVFKFQ